MCGMGGSCHNVQLKRISTKVKMTCSLGGQNDDLWQFVPCPNDGPRQVRKNDSLIWWNGRMESYSGVGVPLPLLLMVNWETVGNKRVNYWVHCCDFDSGSPLVYILCF